MLPQEVFLSHAASDHDFVIRLANVMRQQGVPFWYSRTDVLGAQQWHDEIGMALRRCDWFLLILSPQSVASMWVKRELIFALQQNRFENKIVPILYQSCDIERLSWVLPSFQVIDFQFSFENGCQELSRLWGLDNPHACDRI